MFLMPYFERLFVNELLNDILKLNSYNYFNFLNLVEKI